MSIRKINKRVEAFREEGNLLALVAGLILLFLVPRGKEWIPAVLLLLIAEAAYLTVIPETRFYQRRLSNRYYARVRRRYKKLRKQVLAQLPQRMQDRFDKLEKKRNDISQQQAEDQALLRDIVWTLDYLLEVFLKACRLVVKKETAFKRALDDVRTGSRPASRSSGQAAGAPSASGQDAGPEAQTRKGNIPGFSNTGDWANADVNEIQTYYDRKIAYLQQTIAPGASDDYQAQLRGIIDAYAHRRRNAENHARALTILDAQCRAIEVAFDLVGEQVVSGELEAAREYIEGRMEQIDDGAMKLEELPVGSETPLVESFMGIWEWIGEEKERKQLFVGLLAGAVVVSIFGFGVDTLNRFLGWGLYKMFGVGLPEPLTHEQGWELGALVWSIAFATWFYMTFPVPQSAALVRLIPFLILVVTGSLFVLNAVCVLAWKNETGHVLSILSIGVVFLVTDLILAFHVEETHHKREFWGSVFVADIPIVGGMAVLTLYQMIHGHSGTAEDAREMHAFVSGAVSFQLIFSNVLFALIRGGVFRKIGAGS